MKKRIADVIHESRHDAYRSFTPHARVGR